MKILIPMCIFQVFNFQISLPRRTCTDNSAPLTQSPHDSAYLSCAESNPFTHFCRRNIRHLFSHGQNQFQIVGKPFTRALIIAIGDILLHMASIPSGHLDAKHEETLEAAKMA